MDSEREIPIETFEEDASPALQPTATAHLPTSSVNTRVQRLLEDIYVNEIEDAREELRLLMAQFLAQELPSGDADDFHNLAVQLARRDEYIYACQVLEYGLKLHENSVDLLADYLQYGVNCSKLEECRRFSRMLSKIPRRRWTWRGFTFLIDYLLYLIDRSNSDKEIDAKLREIREVVNDFRRLFPYSEESYRTEAKVYQLLNDSPDNEAEVLREALANVRVAPKCALRYADIMFDRGEYEEAAKAVARALRDATQTQSSVNDGYLYYLSALCKIAMTQESGGDLKMERTDAEDIYSDFNIALTRLQKARTGYTEVIRTKTLVIVDKSGVDVDPGYARLYECIAE